MDDPRAALERERASTLRRLAELAEVHDEFVAASRDTNADDEHDPEGAAIAFERAQLAALLAASRQRLADLDRALARGWPRAATAGASGAGGRSPPTA